MNRTVAEIIIYFMAVLGALSYYMICLALVLCGMGKANLNRKGRIIATITAAVMTYAGIAAVVYAAKNGIFIYWIG